MGKRLRRGTVVRVPPRDHNTPQTILTSLTPVPKGAAKPATIVAVAQEAKATKAAYRTHRVRSGQTLSHIAKQYRVKIAALRQLNGLGDSSALKPGQKLRIPR
jgi:membrane-bound lytic murein transglycosylase D